MEVEVVCDDCTRFRVNPEKPESSIVRCHASKRLPEVLLGHPKFCRWKRVAPPPEPTEKPKQWRRKL
jgi:hypothetical protein